MSWARSHLVEIACAVIAVVWVVGVIAKVT